MHDNTNELPPLGSIDLAAPGADRGYASSILTGLVQECQQSRDPWIVEADRNYQIFAYGADPTPDDDDLVINAIQNAVIAVTDIQTKEPPKVTLDPVETGEPGDTYWNGPQDVGIQLGLSPQQVAEWIEPQTGDAMHPMAVDELLAEQLNNFVLSGMVKPEWVVTVNDQLVADTYQAVFDVVWSRSRCDRAIRGNLLWTNVFGWTLWLYQWDHDRKRFEMREMSVKQAYVDPTVADIDDAAYAGVDLVIDANQAKRLYPQVANEIDEYAREGQPSRSNEGSGYGQVFETVFRRKIVVLRVFWLRDQPCLYPPQVAVERGLVDLRPVPEAIETATRPPLTNDIHARRLMDMVEGEGLGDDPLGGLNYGDDASGQDAEGVLGADANDGAVVAGDGPEPGEQGDPAAGPADSSQAGAPGVLDDAAEPGATVSQGGQANGQPSPVVPVPVAATRAGYFKPGTDEEVDPSHADWPTYPCLRQITLIENMVVDDRECEFFDIPILHNVNIPLSQRPWGIGEPYRLWKLQKSRSRMLNAIVEHCEYFKAPVTLISQSMHDSLVERYKDAYIKPGRTLVVDDEQWNLSGGKLHNVMDPPQTPPALVQMQEIIKGEITELSGYTDVLQGRAQPGVESGKAIELLQGSASSMIGFKSSRTGDFVYRFAMMGLHSIIWRMEVEDVGAIVSKYQPGVLAAIHERARRAEWDVNVTVSSGNGTVLSRKKQDAQNDLSIGALTMESYREKAGIDNRVEEDREKRAAERLATQAAQMQPAGAQGPPAPPPAR